MDIAFSALLVLLLYLPGPLFLYTYFGRLSKNRDLPITFPSFTGKTTVSLVVALLIQVLGYFLATKSAIYLDTPSPNINAVFVLLSGVGANTPSYSIALHSITDHFFSVAGYIALTLIVPVVAGYQLHKLVRRKEWDTRFRWLRFSNEWHYLLSGEVLTFPEYASEDANEDENEKVEIDGTVVTALIDVSGTAYLYVGVLVQYWFDRNDNLDALWLRSVFRRKLTHDRNHEIMEKPCGTEDTNGAFYPINGDFVVIKFSNVINLNVMFLSVEPQDVGNVEGDS